MPRYEYLGRNKSGKEVKGMMDGMNESAAAIELIRQGITPVLMSVHIEKPKNMTNYTDFFQLDMPTTEDLTFLSRQMYSLIKAGVPIVRSVHVVLESAKNIRLKKALTEVLAHLEGGQSLSYALRHHPRIFPPLMTALVHVGENTGSLDQVFSQIAVHFEREANTRRQITAAVRYPITVLVVISVAIVIVNIFVIPAFANFFSTAKAVLPLPTRILIATSDFFVNYWYLLLGGIVGFCVGVKFYIRTAIGHLAWDKWKLKLPLIGSILQRALMARFARSFALSVRTGVPLLEAIAMIAKTTDNLFVSEKVSAMRTYIEHGESLTVGATKSGMFTPLILQMLAIGEETGEIDKLLDEVADYYEQEVDYDVKRLGAAIEPILIVVIAGIVLVLALGIFLPLWDLGKVAGK